jgi:hypothetical protein
VATIGKEVPLRKDDLPGYTTANVNDDYWCSSMSVGKILAPTAAASKTKRILIVR